MKRPSRENVVRADLALKLRGAGLRPTRQRLALAELLFAKGHRHVAAETLHEEAGAADVPVSLATVYNTLHQFTEAGLLRQVAIDGSRTQFDTNVDDHHHFFIEDENTLLDIDAAVTIDRLPPPPPGMEITSVEVVVRVRRTAGRGATGAPSGASGSDVPEADG